MEDTEELRELRATVEEVGEERAETTRALYESLEDAIEEYREEAAGHGNFEKYVEFENIVVAFENTVEEEDVYLQDDFEKALGRLDQRTLQDKHFRRALNDLVDVEELCDDYERYTQLRDELRDELGSLERKVGELDGRIEELEEGIEKARGVEDVDVSELRDAVETYNERVRDDFKEFVRTAPAVEVARLGERISDASLLEDVPAEEGDAERLAEYVDDESVDRVLELADSSDGKLSHYLDDTEGFRSAVPRLWFESSNADSFVISYEPEGTVKYKTRELVPLVAEFADDTTIDALRRVKRMAERGEYSRMRSALVDRREVGDDAESMEKELEEVRTERQRAKERAERIRDALPDESGDE